MLFKVKVRRDATTVARVAEYLTSGDSIPLFYRGVLQVIIV